jgi:hypothetical protein
MVFFGRIVPVKQKTKRFNGINLDGNAMLKAKEAQANKGSRLKASGLGERMKEEGRWMKRGRIRSKPREI